MRYTNNKTFPCEIALKEANTEYGIKANVYHKCEILKICDFADANWQSGLKIALYGEIQDDAPIAVAIEHVRY